MKWDPTYCIQYNWSTTHMQYSFNCIEQAAIHEFGHILGFQHEMQSPAAPLGCHSDANNPLGNQDQYAEVTSFYTSFPNDKLYTIIDPSNYDWDSMMAYDLAIPCSNQQQHAVFDVFGIPYIPNLGAVRFGDINLSPTDAQGLIAIYGHTDDKPAVVSWGNGHWDVFVRGTDNALWHKWFINGQWSGWESLGGPLDGPGPLTSAPAVASWGNGHEDVFVRGTDNALWHKWFLDGHWSGWDPLGGTLTSAPAVASALYGHLDVSVRGTDNALWHRYFINGQWSGWESLGGTLTSAPAAASWGGGRLDVFARGTDNALWHRYADNGQWSGWESLGGTLTSAPAVVSALPASYGHLDVSVLSTNNTLLHGYFFNGQWSGWESWDGTLFKSNGKTVTIIASAPAAASQGNGQVDVFVRGTDNALWHKHADNGQWSGWESLGGTPWVK